MIKVRYYDMIHKEKVAEKSGTEIAAEIIQRAGLEII